MRPRWPIMLVAFLLLPSAIAGSAGDAEPFFDQSAGQSVTRPVAMATPGDQMPREVWETRVRVVAINLAGLPDRATAGPVPKAGTQVGIDLFDGRSINAVFERFDPNTSGVTWVGNVPGVPYSRVTLVYGGGMLAASILMPGESYTIRPMSVDPANPTTSSATPLHILAEIDQARFPRDAEPLEVPISQAALDLAADVVMADAGDVIDLLMVYTPAAEAWAGGPSGIANRINLGVSETNSAYEASGVSQRVQLLHAERVAYTEVNSFSTNLNNLRSGLGTGLGGVAALRNVYGADLVSMYIRPALPDACGIAFLMTSVSTAAAPNGYNVVDASCSPGLVLAHELGHNMGLRHDWFMDAGVTPFTYAHGHVNITNPTGRFRTIMSYPDSCTSLGFGCTWLLAFSNPEKFYLGTPMGILGGTKADCPTASALNMSCDADERRALNETALTVANFRQATIDRPPTIVGQPANQSVVRGQAVVLQIAASGLGPFSYQWYRGPSPATTSPVAGATGPTYAFVPGADGIWSERWLYWARVSNSIGAVNSFTTAITLLPGNASTISSRRTQAQTAAPPPRILVTPARAKIVMPPGVVVRGASSPGVGVTQEADDPDSPGRCSAHRSVLLARAEVAGRSSDDYMTMIGLVLRMTAALSSGPSACGGAETDAGRRFF